MIDTFSRRQVETLMKEAVAAHQQGDGARAQQLYRQILAITPTYIPAREMLGVLADQSGHHEQAISLFQQVIAAQPEKAIPHARLAAAYAQSGRLSEASASAAEAISRNPDDIAMRIGLLNILGKANYREGKLAAAIEQYQQLIAYQPDSAEIHFNLGNLLRDQRQLDEALKHYQRALALRPEWLQAHENMLFIMSYFSLASSAQIFAAHQAWAAALPTPLVVMVVNTLIMPITVPSSPRRGEMAAMVPRVLR